MSSTKPGVLPFYRSLHRIVLHALSAHRAMYHSKPTQSECQSLQDLEIPAEFHAPSVSAVSLSQRTSSVGVEFVGRGGEFGTEFAARYDSWL